MESTLSNAAILLLIGMLSVFFVLLMVVSVSKVLIKAVNKWAPAQQKTSEKGLQINTTRHTDAKIVAAIHGAVAHITFGQGVITKIERVKV